MPDLIIRYKNKRTLEALLDIAKYFDFSVVLPSKSRRKLVKVNGVYVIPADSSVETADLETIFTGKNLDVKELRRKSWQRTK
jgi:hypothetical protein